jgi:hypothetical protein
MKTTEQEFPVHICLNMTQIETDLEATLHKIFEQAGDNIQLEQQEKYTQEMEITKQVFEKFRNKYGCFLTSSKL